MEGVVRWLIVVGLPVARPLVAEVTPALLVAVARMLLREGLLTERGVAAIVAALGPSASKS